LSLSSPSLSWQFAFATEFLMVFRLVQALLAQTLQLWDVANQLH